MIVSKFMPMAIRSSATFKAVQGLKQSQKRLISTSVPRQGWYYRQMPQSDKKWEIIAECAGAFMWWWVFWHLFTDYHHIIGHYEFPDIGAWTNEELGIPPDDADDPVPPPKHVQPYRPGPPREEPYW